MAQGDILVNRSSEDAAVMLRQLEAVRTTAHRITERMESLGLPALDGQEWPEGYSQAEFVGLYTALCGLPGSIVADEVRDALWDLVTSVV